MSRHAGTPCSPVQAGADIRRLFETAVLISCFALHGCMDRTTDESTTSASSSAPDSARTSGMGPSPSAQSTDEADQGAPPSSEPGSMMVPPATWPADLRESGRRPTSIRLRSKWSYAASWEDTVVLYATHAEVMQRAVLVLDMGRHALLGLQLSDGSARWRKGTRGSGPGEFQYGEISRVSDTSILQFDAGLRRLTEWSDQGTLLRSRALPKIGAIRGVCRLDDGTTYVSVFPSGKDRFVGIARLPDDADTLLDRRPLPLSRPIHRTAIDAQMRLYPLGDGSCALGAADESFLAVFESPSDIEVLPLVEQVPPPQVVDVEAGKTIRTSLAEGAPSGVRGVARLGSMIAVAFGGRTSSSQRIVDLYHRRPWRYEGSFLLRGVVRSLSTRDSTLVIVSESDTGFSRIDQFVFRASHEP